MCRGTALVPSCITITATLLIWSARACTHLVHGGRSGGRTKRFRRGQLMLRHFLVCPAQLTSRLCSLVGTDAFFSMLGCHVYKLLQSAFPAMENQNHHAPCHQNQTSAKVSTGVICYFLTSYNGCCLKLLFLREERAAYYWTSSAYWLKNMFIADGEHLNLMGLELGVMSGSCHKAASPNE